MVDESPTVSFKGLISKVLEDHRSRTDPPLLLKNGSQFKKNLEVIISQKQSICCSNAGQTRHKACVNNVPCAGQALRNAFLSNGQDNWKAHVKLARIIRRTYIGLELVEWLMDRCEFIQNRMIASKIWNILLDLGILLSVEQNNVFEDSRSLYQFTFEECEAQSCDFRNQVNWTNAVHLLLQLVPYVQLQLAARMCCSLMAWDCGLRYVFSVSPALQQGPGAATRDREDISRLDMVQRLAKDGCRLLHSPLRATERPAEVRCKITVMYVFFFMILCCFLTKISNAYYMFCSFSENLLDDFLLTYPVFMSTSDLCQALLGRVKEEGRDTLLRKRKVLHLLSQWSSLCADLPRDDEHAKLFLKTLYRYVLDDLYEFPSLEKDLKELQKLLRMQRRHLKDNWHPVRGAQRDRKEVLCRVYMTIDSYVSVRTHGEVSVQELLSTVAERLDCAEDDMVLMAVTYPGEKVLLQSDQCVFSSSLSAAERLHVCRRDLTEIMSPFTDNGQQRSVKMLSMNTWDVAVSLTNCDWSLFSNVHEQELVYFTLSRDTSTGHMVALEQLLQRCNETQQWVMTEVLLCPTLCKRVQLFKKFIKIAAHCKAQRNLNSFFAIIMGLNSPAVSRLTQTWEKVPGKFRKLFSELESLTDPSLNHKAYRDAFRKMKSPKIPFLPLLLKDITFIHEGNKTFLDNLVNFDKLHMIADTVRIIRQCRTDRMGNMLSQKDSVEVRTYINYLHVIDNQQTLFELSHRLEPRT
uniref:Rap guanine nucleotide exchange factor 5-like n=1 Tax=Sinocyclocheilus grahami TaxID=75366 RepID=A0A672LRY5_SINGR